ncbi:MULTISPECIES: ankyrin repeat domain-containing protein [unclassified Candidatus Cardinium]|uniref:ankyrin repeat domain-containing protein n=1 Tax=unclassified Candidatus Cardinium TaxID=2641185 RepID=UPI001FB3CDF5|nr:MULTISPECIES: ankyrin repeat domain-containing protein [unclassified Candidatus Cardinium]
MQKYLNYIVTLFTALFSLNIFSSCIGGTGLRRQGMDSGKTSLISTSDQKAGLNFGLDKKPNKGTRLTPLANAIEKDDKSAVIDLIALENVNINDTGEKPPSLFYTLQCQHPDIALALLKHRRHNELDVTYTLPDTGDTALHLAALNGYTVVVKELLTNEKVDVDAKDSKKYTALHKAAENGHTEVVKLLINSDKTNVNSQTKYADTALHLAAKNGHEAVIKELLNNDRIDLNVKSSGMNLLEWAGFYDLLEVVKELLNNDKVDRNYVNAHNAKGGTVLHEAAWNFRIGVVEALLNSDKVDVNAQHSNGDTALHIAAHWGYVPIAKLLLDHPAIKVNIKNNDGKTPLELTKTEEIKALIKSKLS